METEEQKEANKYSNLQAEAMYNEETVSNKAMLAHARGVIKIFTDRMKWLGHKSMNEVWDKHLMLSEMHGQLETRGEGISNIMFKCPWVHVVGVWTG